MKIGNEIEGTPEEIKDFFENNGLNLEDYVVKPQTFSLQNQWIFIPITLFIAISCIILIFLPDTGTIRKVFTVIDLLIVLWIVSYAHLKFNNKFVTLIICIGLLLITLFVYGEISLIELFEKIEKYFNSNKN